MGMESFKKYSRKVTDSGSQANIKIREMKINIDQKPNKVSKTETSFLRYFSMA